MSNRTEYPLRQLHEPLPSSPLIRFFAHIRDWVRHFTAVNQLQQLTDRQLTDIGVERRQIEAIAEREIARLRAR